MRLLAVLIPSVCVWADDARLTPADREGEVQWLSSLGLKVPQGGPLLERPFDEPFTFRSLLVPTAWWREPFPREVAADALRQDLPLLRVVMEKAYGGWRSAEGRGWDWNRWFTDWDRELAARGDAKLPATDALAAIGRLMDFQLDNHSGPVGPVRFGSGSATAVLASDPAGTCTEMRTAEDRHFPINAKDPAQLPKKSKVIEGAEIRERSGYYISYPARRGKVSSIQCGGNWIAARTIDDTSRDRAIADLAQRPAGEPSYRTVSEPVGYLRLPDFSKENGEKLRALLPTLPKTAGQEKLLIVDLRGNGGGDAPLEALGRWLDIAAVRPAFKFERRQPKSCLYEALRWGYTQVTTQALKPPISASLRANLQHSLDGLFDRSPEGCPVKIEEEHSTWNYRQHVFPAAAPKSKPRLLVLVDNGCGSDCEYLAYVLAASPGSVIAGQNTYGVGQFIQPGYFILPYSRVKMRIALGMSDNYGDGRSFDGYGLDVDVVLDEEARSAAGILKLAEKESGL